jgi:hypothetical protein
VTADDTSCYPLTSFQRGLWASQRLSQVCIQRRQIHQQRTGRPGFGLGCLGKAPARKKGMMDLPTRASFGEILQRPGVVDSNISRITARSTWPVPHLHSPRRMARSAQSMATTST